MDETFAIDGRIVSTDERPVIDAAVIGCGSHAFRNIFPTLQFAPVNLVATCDLDATKAARYADQFGAERSYTHYHELLEAESLDAVFVVLDYADGGRPRYPQIAIDAMEAGCNAWIEKPPAASTDEIREMMRVEEATGQFVHVGYKKVYSPTVRKANEFVERDEFGSVDTITVRYPESLPDRDHPGEVRTHDERLVVLLDHLPHPGSIISYLGGPMESVIHSSSDGGGGFVTIQFESGARGTIHMAAGTSGSSPRERIEVVGEGANVVVDNGIDLHYYPPYSAGRYGRTTTYTDGTGTAPIHWTPEFSLGQLYNKNLFTLGYYGEITEFADCCLDGRKPAEAGTEMSLEILKLYEALLGPEDQLIDL